LADGLWAAEASLRVPFGFEAGRRMTVLQLSSGGLLLHSPTPLDDRLRAAVDCLGEVRFVVAPSKYHGNLSLQQYQDAYPAAQFYGGPGLARRRRAVRFAGELGDGAGRGWAEDVDQALIHGQIFHEVVFLHAATRTLVVGDCCVGAGPQYSAAFRRWGGVHRPERACGCPVPFRFAVRDRSAMRRSLTRILSWDFDRIVVGHGEVVEAGGRAALHNAYAWLLGDVSLGSPNAA
jgi:hypothetical protein